MLGRSRAGGIPPFGAAAWFAAVLLVAVPAAGQVGPLPRYAQPAGATAPVPPAGPEIRLTLPEAVYLGLRRNRAVKSAYLQRVLDKYDLTVAESLLSPKGVLIAGITADRTGAARTADATVTPVVQMLTPLGTSISFAWDAVQSGRRQKGGNSLTGQSSLSLTVIQPLLRGAGPDVTLAPVREARLRERYNQLRLKAAVADTVTAIAGAYHRFIQARQQIVLAKAALKRARELEATNRTLIAAGRMADIDLAQAQSSVSVQELGVLQAENTFDSARLALLSLLALDLHTRIVPADTLTARPVRVEVDTVRALAFENRPDYLAQMVAIDSARIGLDVARNQQLWDLSLVVGVNAPGAGRTAWGATTALPDTKTDLRAGLQLSIPLNNPAIKQQEVQATVGLRQSEVQLEQLRTQVDQQVRDAARTLDTAWRQYTLSRQVRELAQKTLDSETVKLRAGRSSNFQVVTFQDQLRTAENGELTALVAYLDALIALDQTVGATLDTWGIQLNDDGAMPEGRP